MQRAKVLAIGATLLCAAVGTAFADEPPPAGDGTGNGSGEMTPPPVEGGGGGGAMWSESVIDRDDVLRKGGIGAYGGLDLSVRTHSTTMGTPPMTTVSTATSERLKLGGGYGVTNKITVGLEYEFALHDFEIKGPLTLYGGMLVMHKGKLSVAVGAELDFNFTGNGSEALRLGATVRYKIIPKLEIFTGDPIAPSPLGQQISIGYANGANGAGGSGVAAFGLSAGAGLQAMPKLYAYLMTELFSAVAGTGTLNPDDVSGSDTLIFKDHTLVSLGALFAINKSLDVGATLNDDLNHAGDYLSFGVFGRWYK